MNADAANDGVASPDRPVRRLRILFVTTECAPWIKTGGLGDVSAALPKALMDLGHDVRVLLPAYDGVRALGEGAVETFDLAASSPWPAARLRRADVADLDLWLLDCPSLYERGGGPYLDAQGHDYADNAARFGFLARVAADLCGAASAWSPWRPDVLHANDWPTGLAPAYVSLLPRPRPASVFTIHNLAFQGEFDASVAANLALPLSWLDVDGVLHWGRVSMLKAGVRHADVVTTVSPTYAREIQTPAAGFGMDGMLRLRADALHGILNGIDTAVWDPARDAAIARTFGAGDWAGKAANKAALQERVGLAADAGAMLFGVVSRLSAQKGIDLVLDRLDWLVAQGAQLVVLGSGDADLERQLAWAAGSHAGRVAARIGFDDALAHLVEAGADAFLMPSRFEPCGLNQMYSLAYGTPPVVHATGGLADTVVDADGDPEGTGFVLREATPERLQDAVARALRAFAEAPRWHALQVRGMAQRFDWRESARRYEALYVSASASSGS